MGFLENVALVVIFGIFLSIVGLISSFIQKKWEKYNLDKSINNDAPKLENIMMGVMFSVCGLLFLLKLVTDLFKP